MKVTSKINKTNVKKLDSIMQKCLVKSVDAMKMDVIDSQIIPFKTGEMQNKNTFVDDSKAKRGVVLIKTNAIYARRLYFHPEFNFRKHKNPNAQGKWFEIYITGNKKMFVKVTFARFLKRELMKYAAK